MPIDVRSLATRIGRSIVATVRHAVPLIGQALAYAFRTLVDVAGLGHAAFLWNTRRRHPDRAADVATRLAAIRDARASRWSAWRALTAQRRVEVRAAVAVLTIIAVWSGQWYLSRLRTPVQVANSVPTAAASPPDHRPPAPTATPYPSGSVPPVVAPASVEATAADAAALAKAVAEARPGTWVIAPYEVKPALAPQPLGSWDDFKVGWPVVEDAGEAATGPRYRLWYRGCQFSGAEYVCGVGQATSRDGIVWTRAPKPVFVPPDPLDRQGLWAMALAHGRTGYVLWYEVDQAPFSGRRFATLHAATSPDGVTWTAAAGPVYTAVEQGGHLRPSALWDGKQFHVWLIDSVAALDPVTQLFPDMSPDGDLVIVHLTSPDGVHLTRAGDTPIDPLQMDRVPLCVSFVAGEGFLAWFFEQSPPRTFEQGVNVLRSRDGSDWARASGEGLPLNGAYFGSAENPRSMSISVQRDGLIAWFGVTKEHGREAIRAAIHKGTK